MVIKQVIKQTSLSFKMLSEAVDVSYPSVYWVFLIRMYFFLVNLARIMPLEFPGLGAAKCLTTTKWNYLNKTDWINCFITVAVTRFNNYYNNIYPVTDVNISIQCPHLNLQLLSKANKRKYSSVYSI